LASQGRGYGLALGIVEGVEQVGDIVVHHGILWEMPAPRSPAGPPSGTAGTPGPAVGRSALQRRQEPADQEGMTLAINVPLSASNRTSTASDK
jgi:hypothetical protein